MILSDKTIEELIENGRIDIEPDITDEQIQPASLDVRLGEECFETVNSRMRHSTGEHAFQPSVPYLCETLERISLPNDIAAQLTGRSSVGRQGVIVHKTAGWIDPGFDGTITLEIMNFSTQTVSFEYGERIAQLVFFKLDKPSRGYDGQYQHQDGIQR